MSVDSAAVYAVNAVAATVNTVNAVAAAVNNVYAVAAAVTALALHVEKSVASADFVPASVCVTLRLGCR